MAVINLHYRGDMLKAHLEKRRDIEILYSDETDVLLDTGGGVVKALTHFEGEPFFILNSDSIWVEGYSSALPTLMRLWDESRMDGLLLLAAMVSALGYEGWRGDFRLSSSGHVSRVPDRVISPFAFPGVQIAHPRLSSGSAGGNLLHQCDVGSRHCQGPALWHAARRRLAACRQPTGP